MNAGIDRREFLQWTGAAVALPLLERIIGCSGQNTAVVPGSGAYAVTPDIIPVGDSGFAGIVEDPLKGGHDRYMLFFGDAASGIAAKIDGAVHSGTFLYGSSAGANLIMYRQGPSATEDRRILLFVQNPAGGFSEMPVHIEWGKYDLRWPGTVTVIPDQKGERLLLDIYNPAGERQMLILDTQSVSAPIKMLPPGITNARFAGFSSDGKSILAEVQKGTGQIEILLWRAQTGISESIMRAERVWIEDTSGGLEQIVAGIVDERGNASICIKKSSEPTRTIPVAGAIDRARIIGNDVFFSTTGAGGTELYRVNGNNAPEMILHDPNAAAFVYSKDMSNGSGLIAVESIERTSERSGSRRYISHVYLYDTAGRTSYLLHSGNSSTAKSSYAFAGGGLFFSFHDSNENPLGQLMFFKDGTSYTGFFPAGMNDRIIGTSPAGNLIVLRSGQGVYARLAVLDTATYRTVELPLQFHAATGIYMHKLDGGTIDSLVIAGRENTKDELVVTSYSALTGKLCQFSFPGEFADIRPMLTNNGRFAVVPLTKADKGSKDMYLVIDIMKGATFSISPDSR